MLKSIFLVEHQYAICTKLMNCAVTQNIWLWIQQSSYFKTVSYVNNLQDCARV